MFPPPVQSLPSSSSLSALQFPIGSNEGLPTLGSATMIRCLVIRTFYRSSKYGSTSDLSIGLCLTSKLASSMHGIGSGMLSPCSSPSSLVIPFLDPMSSELVVQIFCRGRISPKSIVISHLSSRYRTQGSGFPHPSHRIAYLLLESLDQRSVAINQCLFRLDLGDDGLLYC